MAESRQQVVVYGAVWCGVTTRTRGHLDDLGVPYTYVDVEQDPSASSWVKDQNEGMEIKPTLDVDGEVLSAPPDDELDHVLRDHGLAG